MTAAKKETPVADDAELPVAGGITLAAEMAKPPKLDVSSVTGADPAPVDLSVAPKGAKNSGRRLAQTVYLAVDGRTVQLLAGQVPFDEYADRIGEHAFEPPVQAHQTHPHAPDREMDQLAQDWSAGFGPQPARFEIGSAD